MSDEKKTVTMPMEEYKVLKYQADQAVMEAAQIKKEVEEQIQQGMVCTITIHPKRFFNNLPFEDRRWSPAAEHLAHMDEKIKLLEDYEQLAKRKMMLLAEMKKWSIFKFMKWRDSK